MRPLGPKPAEAQNSLQRQTQVEFLQVEIVVLVVMRGQDRVIMCKVGLEAAHQLKLDKVSLLTGSTCSAVAATSPDIYHKSQTCSFYLSKQHQKYQDT